MLATVPKILLLASLLTATSIAAIEARAQAAPSAYTMIACLWSGARRRST